jgi:endoglucanase
METAQTGPAPRFYGVNLASAEFAPEKLPGVAGKDYIYPTRETAAPFAAMGMNSVRLPILWERIQPEPMGPLDAEEVKRLEASLDDLSQFRQVIVGIHNYGRYKGRPLARGRGGGAALADLWRRLAERTKDRPNVAFGLMNEPHGIPAAEWRAVAEEAAAAIRKTGATNLLLVPGTNWTGGHSWERGGSASNAAVMKGFADPGRNYVFEIHQYLDSNSSGSNPGCVSARVGRERLEGVTRWLREQRAQAILGEFGGDRSETCLAALDDLLSFLRENGDVWVGWNYWAGGDWWGDYMYSIQPKDGRQAPQAALLARHIASYARR